jgi:outer membrane protein assembly factor BamB
MTDSSAAPRRPLRLWPGVLASALGSFSWFVLPILAPGRSGEALVAGLGFGVVVILWWLLASRAPWSERFAALVVAAGAVAIAPRFAHPSITFGMMGYMPFVYAVPVVTLALVVWTVLARGRVGAARWMSMVVVLLVAAGTLTLVRTNGITGDADSDVVWRWSETAEEKLLAAAANERLAPALARETTAPVAAPAVEPTVAAAAPGADTAEPSAPSTPAADTSDRSPVAIWPGFRGPNRDSAVRGVRIETDWTLSPPVEIWRRPIGPGWSSFAVGGALLYTQEQRGDDEVVSAYSVSTGEPVWRHRDAARFWESNAGAGPRGTPTIGDNRLYSLGATGILNALNARDGGLIWSRNAVTDTKTTVPDWGIAGSPIVMPTMVVVASAGVLAAYDRATGAPRWTGPRGGWGYASPHLATIDGVEQIVLLNGAGAIGVSAQDGGLLWSHEWRGDGILQPAIINGADVLLGSGSGLNTAIGVRRLGIIHGPGGWRAEERWTTNGLKPYYSDFVVHGGHAYGFDGSILACIDLADGARKWKGGRYGHGQLMLLPDQSLLLVLSEEGELALVSATPDKFTEIARMRAISGKTWNHPVLAGDTLVVRNGEEMAAFRLARR